MSWSTFCALSSKSKRILSGLVGLAVETASAAVPGVGLVAKLVATVAEKTTEDILDPRSPNQKLPPDQLQQVQIWLGSLATSYNGLLVRLEKLELPTENAANTSGELAVALKQVLTNDAELSRNFDECLIEVRRQTLSLRMVEERLDELFHSQHKIAAGLEEIKELFFHSPLMSDWAALRKARPESVQAILAADAHFLAGEREQGLAILLELLKKRGVGEATLAHHVGLVELGGGHLKRANERLRQATQVQGNVPTPEALTALTRVATISSRANSCSWRSLPRGFVVNRKYATQAEVGRGGMASVYRAARTATFEKGAIVALKVPAPHLMSDSQVRQRFEQEIEINRQLSQSAHPNIVRVFDYEVFDDPHTNQELYGLVMEFVEGESLNRYLACQKTKQSPLSIETIDTIIRQVAAALHHAHSQQPQVLHRDIKPHNVMLMANHRVKLMDFGIARVLDEARDELTQTGQVVGTAAYMPPEMLSASGNIDVRTDVYMLGNLLLELLTFDPAGDPESRKDCPADWLDLIADSMNRIRGKRPASVADFVSRLDIASAPTPTTTDEPSPTQTQEDDRLFRESYQLVFAVGVRMDRPAAIRNLLRLGQRGDIRAQSLLAACYQMGYGVAEDLPEAQRWGQAFEGIKRLAEAGDPYACTLYGWQLRGGLGCRANDFEGAAWFRKAAEQGEAVGRWVMSLWCRDGVGVPQSVKEALLWAQRAANQDHALAQTELGRIYEAGRGVAIDSNEAVKWYRRAAQKGEPFAMNNLGVCYREGKGVNKDDDVALDWFRQAAEADLPLGYCNLGYMYDVGRGVPKNAKEALKWYHKAAARGNATAMYNIGICYRDGKGVEKSKQEAITWFRRADEAGDQDAAQRLAELQK